MGLTTDCNENDVPDRCDIAHGIGSDCDENGLLDSCDNRARRACDNDENGVLDHCYVLYVNELAVGEAGFLSWDTACPGLQQALLKVAEDPEAFTAIWVAAGTYRPGSADDSPAATFRLPGRVALYGGFQGNKRCIEQRDLTPL